MNLSSRIPISGNIFAVDDTPANLRLLNDILSRDGHSVRCTVDAADALQAALLDPPDMFLIDIVMPEVNGYELCHQIKGEPSLQEIPIIFISSLDDTRDKISAFEHGAVDYITKPFQMMEVLARVNAHLSLWIARREMQRFSQLVAHDLRSPLSNILLSAQLLQQDASLAEDLSPQIEQTAESMSHIIDAMMVLAELHHPTPPLSKIDMLHIASQAVDMLAPMIRDVKAEIDIAEELPNTRGVPAWVLQLWLNFIGNGIKYGGKPPRLKVGGELVSEHRVRFWVQDNGPGLTHEQQAVVFNAYKRGEGSSGHGLGLAIAKRIVERLDGTVGVESNRDEGARFFFELPNGA